MWWIRGDIDPVPFGERRVVLQVLLSESRRERFWLVITAGDVSLVLHRPRPRRRHPAGVVAVTLYEVWEGSSCSRPCAPADLLAARRDLLLVLPDVLQLSPVAPYVRRAQAAPSA